MTVLPLNLHINQSIRPRWESYLDPYLSHIFGMGYDHVIYIPATDIIRLYRDSVWVEIGRRDFSRAVSELSMIRALSDTVGEISWIKEADGSADKFRTFLGKLRRAHGSIYDKGFCVCHIS